MEASGFAGGDSLCAAILTEVPTCESLTTCKCWMWVTGITDSLALRHGNWASILYQTAPVSTEPQVPRSPGGQ